MRIIQITPRYLPFYGGVEIHVKYISEWLARMHEVVVLTCDPVGGLPREEIINGVFVRRFRGFAPGEAYYFSPEMALEIKRAHPDILHAHNYHAFPFFASALGTSKLVVTPHYHGRGHTWLRNILLGGFRPIGKVVFGKADKILYLSSHERRLLKEHFGIGDSKLYFLPNGVDPSELRNPKTKTRKQNQKTILCVSRLQKYKGIHYAIHALSHLDSRFELEIVGTGPYKKDLIRLVKETGL
ncbi:MAG: glycosyltransferase family 4 protein, partial [Theionarchaea archaeon]|nr:glycosyltransferase family 4 protein [Theionarchaea archaeon]